MPNHRPAAPLPSPDPVESAQAAGLRYVSDTSPGIRRRRSGAGFSYVGPDGRAVRDRATLDRIRRLAIPPAYTDVWICPSPNGHLQATGRDARGRKQYRYHPRWRETRDETKFGRMIAFSRALPKIRTRLAQDLARPGLPREKVLATVVRLLECTAIRVGNDEYAKTNRSYGLTTLRNKHVEVSGSTLRFEFRGKSGKLHEAEVSDPKLARIVARCQALPGEELFQYLDDQGQRVSIGSEDVNDYLREITGEEFTAKDFRTWVGTLQAVAALRAIDPPTSAREAKAAILSAIDKVAGHLNNTRAVCRKYYVHPAVLATFEAGTLHEVLGNGRTPKRRSRYGLDPAEQAVVRLLRAVA